MAIYCVKCEAECSEQAESCPACGHPLTATAPGSADFPEPRIYRADGVTIAAGLLITVGLLVIAGDLLLLIVRLLEPYGDPLTATDSLLTAAWLIVGLLLCILAALIRLCRQLARQS